MKKWFLETFDGTGERVVVVLIGICFVLSLVFLGFALDAAAQEPTTTPVPTATATPTATPTPDPEVVARAFRTTICLDSVRYFYLSRTGIEIETGSVKYAVTDSGAEITGTANSDDESLKGPLDFKCVYSELMGEPMVLTEIEVTEAD